MVIIAGHTIAIDFQRQRIGAAIISRWGRGRPIVSQLDAVRAAGHPKLRALTVYPDKVGSACCSFKVQVFSGKAMCIVISAGEHFRGGAIAGEDGDRIVVPGKGAQVYPLTARCGVLIPKAACAGRGTGIGSGVDAALIVAGRAGGVKFQYNGVLAKVIGAAFADQLDIVQRGPPTPAVAIVVEEGEAHLWAAVFGQVNHQLNGIVEQRTALIFEIGLCPGCLAGRFISEAHR